MKYYIDASSTNLDDLQTRLQATDLIPSHQPLLEGMAKKMGLLKKAGVNSLTDLRARMKSKKSLASLADDSGVDPDYLVLLRRVVEGFFPKPQALKVFDWLEKNTVVKLEKVGVSNTLQLFETASSGADALVKNAGLKKKDLSELIALSDLSRVQWVSPTFARVLVVAGFTKAAAVAKAKPEVLYDAIMRANEDALFYKGKVGLRDIKRLVVAATYVP